MCCSPNKLVLLHSVTCLRSASRATSWDSSAQKELTKEKASVENQTCIILPVKSLWILEWEGAMYINTQKCIFTCRQLLKAAVFVAQTTETLFSGQSLARIGARALRPFFLEEFKSRRNDESPITEGCIDIPVTQCFTPLRCSGRPWMSIYAGAEGTKIVTPLVRQGLRKLWGSQSFKGFTHQCTEYVSLLKIITIIIIIIPKSS